MFKRHVYTCPDVIYIRNRAKQNNRIAFGLSLVGWGIAIMYGRHLTNQIDQNIEELQQEN